MKTHHVLHKMYAWNSVDMTNKLINYRALHATSTWYLFKQTATDIRVSCINGLLRYTEHYTQPQQSSSIFITELPIIPQMLKVFAVNFLCKKLLLDFNIIKFTITKVNMTHFTLK